MRMRNSVALLAAIVTSVTAHMQMSNPYPIDSPLNPAVPYDKKDYSYTSPLSADGSNYPCKGYHTQTPILFTASYVAGQGSNIQLAGSAVHGGGSCQISLSYDNGATFKVIKSILGGCPIDKTSYGFTIPSYAPSGNALLAWTWFNKQGNREMYMNCAWVKIAPGSSKSRRSTRSLRRDAASFSALPNIFLANIPQSGNVKTYEGVEVTFPAPGSVIEYGGTVTAGTPLGQGYAGTSTTNDGVRPPAVIGSSSSPSALVAASTSYKPASTQPTSVATPPASTSASSIVFTVAPPAQTSVNLGGIFLTVAPSSNTTSAALSTATSPATSQNVNPAPISSPAAQSSAPTSSPTTSAPPTSVSSPPAATTTAVLCPPGSLLCPSTGTFALCNADGTATPAQPVAPGTQCSNGQIVLASAQGSCDAAPGVWLCTHGGTSFSSCAGGQWVNMGSVAPGTACRNGVIVAA